MAITVLIHKKFLEGTLDTEFAVDIKNLSIAQRAALDKWMADVGNGKMHDGRNKESWLYSSGLPVPNTKKYSDTNAWHYHSGPTIDKIGSVKTGADLPRNIPGDTTKECIHYFKNAKGIAIFGFSKDHIPFLNDGNLPAGTMHPFATPLRSPYNTVVFFVPQSDEKK